MLAVYDRRVGHTSRGFRWWVLGLSACGRLGFDAPGVSPSDALATGDAVSAPPGAIAWYRFDDDPSDGVLDSSGNGHHGNCAMCPALVEDGREGSAYHFSGQLIRVPYVDALTPENGVTASAWLRLEAAPAARVCLGGKLFASAYENSWGVCVDPGLSVVFYSARPNDELTSPDGILAIARWHHVAITWDGAVKRVWIDGTERASTSSVMSNDDGDVLLGGDEDSGLPGFFVTGALDEVRLYDRALDAAEIAALAQ